jgi:hypothetical protein
MVLWAGARKAARVSMHHSFGHPCTTGATHYALAWAPVAHDNHPSHYSRVVSQKRLTAARQHGVQLGACCWVVLVKVGDLEFWGG